MIHKISRTILLLAAVMFCVAQFGRAQEKDKVKRVPIETTSPASGEEMFKTYCAACHGKDAKGRGPASSELKTMPHDLTTLAKRHDGKFPSDYVATVLRNGASAGSRFQRYARLGTSVFGCQWQGSGTGHHAHRQLGSLS